jgi:hypothetical protein
MATFETDRPFLGLGMTSTVLGTIGLILFFLPILGIPISAFGLLAGLLGVPVTILGGGTSLRWSLAGLLLSSAALVVNLAIVYTPGG